MPDKSMVQGDQATLAPNEPAVRPQDLPRATAPVDIYENEHEFMVLADLPGVALEDVDIRLESGRLTLIAPQTLQGEEQQPVCFERAFMVPESVEPDGVTAELHRGVLTLRLAKSQRAQPRRIQVQTG